MGLLSITTTMRLVSEDLLKLLSYKCKKTQIAAQMLAPGEAALARNRG